MYTLTTRTPCMQQLHSATRDDVSCTYICAIRAALQHAARVRVQSGVTAATTASRRLSKVDFRRNLTLAYTTIPRRLFHRFRRRFCHREDRFQTKKASRLAFRCVADNVYGIDRRGGYSRPRLRFARRPIPGQISAETREFRRKTASGVSPDALPRIVMQWGKL